MMKFIFKCLKDKQVNSCCQSREMQSNATLRHRGECDGTGGVKLNFE